MCDSKKVEKMSQLTILRKTITKRHSSFESIEIFATRREPSLS